ncbi:MAG: hypothetical protein ACERLM_11750 [Acidimicrobiales bacterium]
MVHRALVVVSVVVASFLFAPSVAADGPACDQRTCHITGTYERIGDAGSSEPVAPRPRPASTYVPCKRDGGALTAQRVTSNGDDYYSRLASGAGHPIPHPPPPGDQWVFSLCSVSPGGAFYLDGPPTLAVVGVTDARPFQWAALARAIAIVELHQPQLATSPPLDAHVVAVPGWIATTPATTTVLAESATDGPVTVTITATPTHLTFDPGDGTPELTCTPAPTTPAEACSHTYPVNGTFGTTAHLHYTVDWTSTIGGAGTIVDGAVTTTPTPLTVREIQSLIR